MSRRLFLFKKAPKFASGGKIFTHFWENEGQNYFDSVEQSTDSFGHVVEEETLDFVSSYEPLTSIGPTEAYLDQFRSKNDDGDETGYTWAELDSTRYQRETITTIKVEMTVEDFIDSPVLFFKLIDWDEEKGMSKGLPLYYYSTNVSQVSDQNYETTSYSVECTLDMWATIWIYMHSVMKNCKEELKWSRKMADRFIWAGRKDGEEGYGFWIDYLTQIYLTRTDEWKSKLIVSDERNNFLSLDDWLYINSNEKSEGIFKDTWLEDTWLPWISNQWCAFFNPLGNDILMSGETIKQSFDLKDCYKRVAYTAFPIDDNSFNDSDYNSNSKYRYLVCKIGNNTWPTASDEGADKSKGVMFSNNKLISYHLEPSEALITTNETSLDTGTWNRESNNLTFYKDIKISDDVVSADTFMMSFEDYIFNKKYFKINIGYGDTTFSKDYIFVDGLDKKLQHILIDGLTQNEYYKIVKLPAKSFVYDLDGHSSSLIPEIGAVFTSDGIYLRFKCSLELNIGDLSYEDILKIKISFAEVEDLIINPAILFNNISLNSDKDDQRKINGESLILIPIKKGYDEQLYIEYLNNPTLSGITMGDGSVLGMVINDIPPSVLAMALRTFANNSESQPLGDAMSVRTAESNYSTCPLSIVNVSLQCDSEKKNSIYQAPCIFSEFDYIPVCVATSPNREGVYSVIGGNNFFNYLYDILTNDSLTKTNVKECEPLLYGPAFWKWTYFINGNNAIELTADLLDLKKMVTEDSWNIYLNVNMTDSTHYFLDFSDLKNSKYPMSKIGMEYIISDSTNYPFTTEAYTHWLQNNQWTKETSKNANEIKNKYARTQATVNAVVSPFAGIAGGVTAGLTSGLGSTGAAIGAIGGAVSGGIKSLTTMMGVNNAIKQANEEWNNKWKGDLGNAYSSPTFLSSGGFETGSLVYSPNVSSLQSSYELFKTYRLPDLYRDLVWHDVSMNGYMYLSEEVYSSYNNRVNFNIVNCLPDDKAYSIIQYLREKMFEISPLLAQQDSIATFFDKCKNLFRVFKCEYDEGNLENIVKGNIEIERLWYKPFYGAAMFKKIGINGVLFESQLEETWKDWMNNYTFGDTGSTYSNKNTESGKISIAIPYSKLGNYTSYSQIVDAFDHLSVDNKGSYVAAIADNLAVYEKVNSLEYSSEKSITFSDYELGTTKSYYNIKDYGIFGKLLTAAKDSAVDLSEYYENGWNITINADDDDKKVLTVECVPYSKFTFSGENTLDDTWTVDNNWSEFTRDLTNSMFDIQNTWYDTLGKEKTKWSWFNEYEALIPSTQTDSWQRSDAGFGINLKYAEEPHDRGFPVKWNDNAYNRVFNKIKNKQYLSDNEIDWDKSKTLMTNIPFELISGNNSIAVSYNEEINFNFYSEAKSGGGELGDSLNTKYPSIFKNSSSTISAAYTIKDQKIKSKRIIVGRTWFYDSTFNCRFKSLYDEARGYVAFNFNGYNLLYLELNDNNTYDLKLLYVYIGEAQTDKIRSWTTYQFKYTDIRCIQISSASDRKCSITFNIPEETETSWTMNNQINNIIFVSKDNTSESNRAIKINK